MPTIWPGCRPSLKPLSAPGAWWKLICTSRPRPHAPFPRCEHQGGRCVQACGGGEAAKTAQKRTCAGSSPEGGSLCSSATNSWLITQARAQAASPTSQIPIDQCTTLEARSARARANVRNVSLCCDVCSHQLRQLCQPQKAQTSPSALCHSAGAATASACGAHSGWAHQLVASVSFPSLEETKQKVHQGLYCGVQK